MQNLIEMLKRHEGEVVTNGRHLIYKCSAGHWTIGIGRNVDVNGGLGLSDEEVELILSTPNSQGDGTEDLSIEQYQKFHDAARDSGGYALRGYGLGLAGVMVLVGGIMLLFLKGAGAKLAVGGATLGMASGISGSLLVKGAADEHLVGILLLNYEIYSYLCGVCMFMCAGVAALPLINARARLALYPENKVQLKTDAEE